MTTVVDIARIIAGYVAHREWDEMAEDRFDLRSRLRDGFDINEPTRSDCREAARDIFYALQVPKTEARNKAGFQNASQNGFEG